MGWARKLTISLLYAGASAGLALQISNRLPSNVGASSNGGLLKAIEDNAGSGSEANGVISHFQQLSAPQQQDLLNFLRPL